MSETNEARTQTQNQPPTKIDAHGNLTGKEASQKDKRYVGNTECTQIGRQNAMHTIPTNVEPNPPRQKANSLPTHSSLGPMPRFIVPLRDGYLLLALHSRERKPGQRPTTTTIANPKQQQTTEPPGMDQLSLGPGSDATYRMIALP